MTDIKNEIILNLGSADAPIDQEPKIIDSIHVLKQAKYEDWKATSEGSTPFIPLNGEILLVTDSQGCFKIGNGINTFKDLPWSSAVKIEESEGILIPTLNLKDISIEIGRIVNFSAEAINTKSINTETIKAKSITLDLETEKQGWIIANQYQAGLGDKIVRVYRDSINFLENEVVTATLTAADVNKLADYNTFTGFSFTYVTEKPTENSSSGAYLKPKKDGSYLTGYDSFYVTKAGKVEDTGIINIKSTINLEALTDITVGQGVDNFNNQILGKFSFTKNSETINCLQIGNYTLEEENCNGIIIGNLETDWTKERKFSALSRERFTMWNYEKGGAGTEINIRPLVDTENEDRYGQITIYRRKVGGTQGISTDIWLSDLTSDALLNRFYPVGSLYWTIYNTENTNPNNVIGGTWERLLTNGGFPYIIGTNEGYSGNVYTNNWNIDNFPIAEHTHEFCSQGGNLSYTYSWGIKSGLKSPVSIQNAGSNSMKPLHCDKNEIITNQDYWCRTAGVTDRYLNRALPYPPHINVYCWVRKA